MSKSRLFSGKIKKATGTNLSADRYKFLDVANAEPDFGSPPSDNYVLVSSMDGTRAWDHVDNLVGPNTQVGYATTAGTAEYVVNAVSDIQAGNDILISANTGSVQIDFINNTGYITTSNFEFINADLLPSDTLTYNLGSIEKQWASLYVGTATIYIDNNAVSINEYRVLTVNGDAVVNAVNTRGNGISTEFNPSTGVVTLSSTGVTNLDAANGITLSNSTGSVTVGFDTSTLVTIATTLVDGASISLHSLTVDHDTIFNGPVTYNNTTTYNITTNTVYTDNLIEIHAPPTGVDSNWTYNDGKDIGLRFHYYDDTLDSDENAAFVFSHDERAFEFYVTGYESTGTFVGDYGTIKVGGIKLTNDSHPSYLQFGDGSQQTFAYTGTNINVASADTAANVSGGYVRSVTAGTDTVVSTSTGDVTIWDISTFQSVTSRGNSTTNQIILNGGQDTNSTQTGALVVNGGIGVSGNMFVGGIITATNLILGALEIDFGSVFNGFDSTDDVNIIGGNLNVSSATTTATASTAVFRGTLDKRILTVTSITTGTIVKGMIVSGPGIINTSTAIQKQQSGTIGGIGKYELTIDNKTVVSTISTYTGTLSAAQTTVYNGGGITAYYITATNINATNITAVNFYGNLTGNVTGNVTGNLSGNATTANNLSGNQKANSFYAGPSSGSDAAGRWRQIVAADIPTLNQDTTGVAGNIYGGSANQILYQSAKDNTSYITAPNTVGTYLGWNGTAFAWSVPAYTTATAATLGAVRIGTGINIAATGVISLNTATLVASAVSASTATNAAFAYAFNTGTLVTTAVTALSVNNAAFATTASFATTSGFAQSFNTGTLVTTAVNAGTATNAAFAYSFNTGTLVTTAVNATTATNAATAYSVAGGYVASITAGSNITVSTATGAITISGTTASTSSNYVNHTTVTTFTSTVIYNAANSVRFWTHSGPPTANWTPNITNLALTNNQATTVKMVLPPSSANDYNMLPPQIDGVLVANNYGFNLKASKNKTNFFTLDISRDNTGTYSIFGAVTSY